MGGVSFDPQPDGLYATYKVGADAVRKKLQDNSIIFKEAYRESKSNAALQYEYVVPDGVACVIVLVTCPYVSVSMPDGYYLFNHGSTGFNDDTYFYSVRAGQKLNINMPSGNGTKRLIIYEA